MSNIVYLRTMKTEESTSFDELETFSETTPLRDFLEIEDNVNLETEDLDVDKNVLNYNTDKKDIVMTQNMYNELLFEIKDLKAENKITNARIDNTNKIIAIVGGLIGLVLTVFIFASNTQYNAIKDINNSNMQSIQTEIKAINQRLNYQEQLNDLNIQNQIRKELKK